MRTSFWRTATMLLLAVAWCNVAARGEEPIELTNDFDVADAAATDEAIATGYNQEAVQGIPEAVQAVPEAVPMIDGAVVDPSTCDVCGECCDQCECGCGGGGGGFFAGLLGGGGGGRGRRPPPGGGYFPPFGGGARRPVPPAYADQYPGFGCYALSGWDNFRGITTGTFGGKNGFVNGFNVAAPVPLLSEFGLAAQAGMTYGFYDLGGRASPVGAQNASLQQYFITTGVFRRADIGLPLSFGIVYDWNVNNNYGVFNNSPTLGQWRGQVAWACSAANEIGLFGMLRDRGDSKDFDAGRFGTFDLHYKAISQGNVFWHHKFLNTCGAESWMYVGLPDRRRLSQDDINFNPGGAGKSLGAVIFGSNWLVPINDYMSLYANGMYMKPTAHSGVQVNALGAPAFASVQEFWNIGFGVQFFPGGAARSSTVAGRKWAPYLPVANNSTFLVDTNETF